MSTFEHQLVPIAKLEAAEQRVAELQKALDGGARWGLMRAQELHSEIDELQAEVATLSEKLDREKAARIYYQDIVYAVCNVLDEILGRNGPDGGIVCGTLDQPTHEVQDAVRHLQSKLDMRNEHVMILEQQVADAIAGAVCPICKGFGKHIVPGAVLPCSECKTTGTMAGFIQTMRELEAVAVVCPRCKGAKKIYR